jgi:hypothetical protein
MTADEYYNIMSVVHSHLSYRPVQTGSDTCRPEKTFLRGMLVQLYRLATYMNGTETFKCELLYLNKY